MKIILTEKIDKLGNIGDVVSVKNGYAKNYLFPKKKALSIKNFEIEKIREKLISTIEKRKKDDIKNEEKLNNINIIIPVSVKKNEEIYGSFNLKRFSKIIKKLNLNLNMKNIENDFFAKKIGNYKISFKNKKINKQIEIYLTLLRVNK